MARHAVSDDETCLGTDYIRDMIHTAPRGDQGVIGTLWKFLLLLYTHSILTSYLSRYRISQKPTFASTIDNFHSSHVA